MSRAIDSAVLNVDSYTIDEMYGNDMGCNLHYENTFESGFNCVAAAASSELTTVECEFGLASNTEANEKSDSPNLQLDDDFVGWRWQNVESDCASDCDDSISSTASADEDLVQQLAEWAAYCHIQHSAISLLLKI